MGAHMAEKKAAVQIRPGGEGIDAAVFHIAESAADLFVLATARGHLFLGYLLQMVQLEAERISDDSLISSDSDGAELAQH